MNKPTFKFFKKASLCLMLLMSGCFATSCFEDVTDEQRFTFTGELIADHLASDTIYEKFVTILKKASLNEDVPSSIFMTLSTYGSYTCFAPTNAAIDEYLREKMKDPKSGITSMDIELLDDSIATEIAKNHIIEKGYKTMDTPDGEFPKATMNRRTVTLTTKSGEVWLDNTSRIINKDGYEMDYETENGIIQTIDKVINPSTKKVWEQILMYPELKLFGDAIVETGLDSLLDIYEYSSDYIGDEEAVKFVKNEGEAYSPLERKQRYTVLVETNELLANPENNHLGLEIKSLEDLETLAQEFYGKKAPGKYKDPQNALHQFIRYHIIDRQLHYTGGPGGFIMEQYVSGDEKFKSESNLPTTFDRYDYFETMLPYSMIKVTRPFTNNNYKNDIVINYAQENGTLCNIPNMQKYLNVIVLKKEDSGVQNFNQKALNGALHTINKILIYNEDEMAGNVLNERMRWDISSLFPEWTNNGVRWEENSIRKTTYIPDGYSERLRVRGVVANTTILYLRPHGTSTGGYPNYQGDELLAIGKYDFEYRIPHVPSGSYEIRFGYSTSTERAITQFYYDNETCDIPVDMALGSKDPLIGWVDEDDKTTETEKRENDRNMQNRLYMKGPASCVLDTESGATMRESPLALRKIIGRFKIDKGDHWLRFKNVTENEKTDNGNWVQFNQDFLEIVPVSVIENKANPEDQY